MHLPQWMSILRSSGAYAADGAPAAARMLLPDPLHYRRSGWPPAPTGTPSACPNGHAPTKDVFGVPPGRALSVPTGLLTDPC
jgi:hypothetical protein